MIFFSDEDESENELLVDVTIKKLRQNPLTIVLQQFYFTAILQQLNFEKG
jgi:hypothetical protein